MIILDEQHHEGYSKSPPRRRGRGGQKRINEHMQEHIHNWKNLKDQRRQLRNNSTSAEASLWKLLSKRQLEGRKFRRQHSIKNYIVDFYCPSEKLAIELDGDVHFSEQSLAYDVKRDDELKALGIRVLRFENDEVFKATNAVLEKIKSYFGEDHHS